ncbi:glucose-6-phosphate isomerase [Alkalihalobacillus sp. FSL R5-0424]
MTLSFQYKHALPFMSEDEIALSQEQVNIAHQKLHKGFGAGSDYLGWVDLPHTYDKKEVEQIKLAATRIQKQSDALIVIGIGGSYLGARAAIDALGHSFHNQMGDQTEIYYAGHNISTTYILDLLEMLEGKDISINVISKSGTTTEPALAFRLFREYMENKYGKEGSKERIYVTTDQKHGALKEVADTEGYETFVIPDDVGGRYSILTAVGLLPIAAAGIDIDQMLLGAAAAAEKYNNPNVLENECYQYAVVRQAFYNKGKAIELLVNYDPRLHYLAEWWKQLFGESEGKDQKGMFPAAVDFSTDLHSMGQYVQEGRRNLIETVLQIKQENKDLHIKEEDSNKDGINYLSGKTLAEVNRSAFEGTLLAHIDGDVPNLVIELDELNAFTFGELIYFFEKACGISGHLLGVNPFNQPGVEAYKQNMFALLGKPGYEAEREVILERLGKGE